MRNKKICFIIGIFLFSGLMSLTIPQARADIGVYKQQTNLTNPFTFEVDTIYTTADGYFSASEIQTFYHQVYLEEDNYYAFYISNGYIYMDVVYMWFHSALSTAIDNYLLSEFDNSSGRFLLYFNPTNTGLYNITIRCGEEGYDTHCSGSIGVLKIPIVQLDTEIKSNYWDFISNSIMIGIIDLESGKEYQTGRDGLCYEYSNYEIYYSGINTMYSPRILDETYTKMEYNAEDIITTSNLGYGYGKYLFYSLETGASFSLMESIEEEQSTPPDLGIIIWIIILSVVGLIAIVGIYKYKMSKKKSNELIPRWTKKVELSAGMKFCSNCGQEIKKEATFCEFCGKEQ